MHRHFVNVNDAFTEMVEGIHNQVIPTEIRPSRVGETLQIPEPMTLTYEKPLQRVLFNEVRDANPFFHVYDSLWMLAGRNDIAPLDYYSSNYSKQVKDGDSDVANGAYGYRWRHSLMCMGTKPVDGIFRWGPHCDQLEIILDHLKQKPESRRAVLQMWNVEDDLLKIDSSKDVACNTAVYFSIRDGAVDTTTEQNEKWATCRPGKFLDMTVTNRSNDLVWGCLGANYVHFSFLQEYMANCLGIEVGRYHQMSNNLHAYSERWTPSEWLASAETSPRYIPAMHHVSLVREREVFDKECAEFVEVNKNGERATIHTRWSESFLDKVAQPMMMAFHCHKAREYPVALDYARSIKADDWRIVALNWLTKRRKNWESRIKGEGVFDNA